MAASRDCLRGRLLVAFVIVVAIFTVPSLAASPLHNRVVIQQQQQQQQHPFDALPPFAHTTRPPGHYPRDPPTQGSVNAVSVVAPMSPLPPARSWHSASSFAGHFVIFGGGGINTTLNDLWRFNVTTHVWSEIKQSFGPSPRLLHSLVKMTVEQKDVLIAFGGFANFGNNGPVQSLNLPQPVFLNPLRDTWILDWLGLNWIKVADSKNQPPARGGHVAVSMGDRYMVVFGGAQQAKVLDDTWILPVTSVQTDLTWLHLNSSTRPPARMSHVASTISGNELIMTGGCSSVAHSLCPGETFDDVWMFTLAPSVAQSTWQLLQPTARHMALGWNNIFAVDNATHGRMAAGLSFLPDTPKSPTGKLLLISGTDGFGRWFAETESFDSNDHSWISFGVSGSAPLPRLGLTASYVPEYEGVIVFGGYSSSLSLHNDMWLLEHSDCGGPQWTEVTISTAPEQRVGFDLNTIDGKLVMFGGYDGHWPAFNDLWVFDPTKNSWAQQFPMNTSPKGRFGHVLLTKDSSEELIVFGGQSPGIYHVNGGTMCNDLWSYNMKTKIWVELLPKGKLPEPRLSMVGASFGDNLIIAGGKDLVSMTNSSWIYSFSKNAWTELDTAPSARFASASSLVSHSNDTSLVLFAGSSDWFMRTFCDDVWAFSFTAQKWTLVNVTSEDRPSPRAFHAAATIGDWGFLIYGGMANTSTLLSDAWIGQFVGSSFSWTRVPSSRSAELAMHSLVVLPSSTTCYLFGGRTVLSTSNLLFRFDYGCGEGSASENAMMFPCKPCPMGTYAKDPGSTQCAPCPTRTTTEQNGSTSPTQCNKCEDGVCKNQGRCRVDSLDQSWQCTCTFWYAGPTCSMPWFAITVGGGIGVIALVLVSVAMCRRVRRKMHKYKLLQSEQQSEIAQKDREIHALNKAWEILPEELTMIRRIDTNWEGSFGEVWLAEWHGRQVAVKKPRHIIVQLDPEAMVEFESEIRIMRELRHRNVVYFYGAGHWLREPFLVTEFLDHGSLAAILMDETIQLSYRKRINFLINAAHGMNYLHSHDPPVLHRDLKTGNLFVSADWTVKVGDFGYGRLFDGGESRFELDMDTWSIVSVPHERERSHSQSASYHGSLHDSDDDRHGAAAEGGGPPTHVKSLPAPSSSKHMIYSSVGMMHREAARKQYEKQHDHQDHLVQYTGLVGTPAYMAPELLERKHYGLPVDVYSYAICCWEVFTRQVPYMELTNKWRLVEQVLAGKRPEIPHDCPMELVLLMKMCWAQEPNDRPTFAAIVDRLGLL